MRKIKDLFEEYPAFKSFWELFYILFSLAIFFIALDFTRRYQMMISEKILVFASRLSPKELILNIAVTILFFSTLAILIALTLCLCEILLSLSIRKYRKLKNKFFSYFLIYITFVIVNTSFFILFIKGILGKSAFSNLPDSNFFFQIYRIFFIIVILLSSFLFVRFPDKIASFFKENLGKFKVLSFACLFIPLLVITYFNITKIGQGNKGTEVLLNIASQNKLPNIIFITLDTLMNRQMSLYGYKENTTPNMDLLAKESCVFENMHSNSNNTARGLPNFLGKYNLYNNRRSSGLETLPGFLRSIGYKTVFISPAVPPAFAKEGVFSDIQQLSRTDCLGFFNNLSAIFGRENLRWTYGILTEWIYILGDRFYPFFTKGIYWTFPEEIYFERAKEYLESFNPHPIFVWAHILAPHKAKAIYFNKSGSFFNLSLQDRAQEFGDKEKKEILDIYNKRLKNVDRLLGEFLIFLKSKNMYRNSLIIISSDHGDELDKIDENRTPYLDESVIHIPLLIHVPQKNTEAKINAFAEQVDIAPTVINVIGVPIPAWMEGESLVKYMEGGKNITAKPKISITANCDLNNNGKAAVFLNGYKLIYDFSNKRTNLYNIIDDFKEQYDMSDKEIAITAKLKSVLMLKLSQYEHNQNNN